MPKEFTPAQIKRLPEEGYWVAFFNAPQYQSKTTDSSQP